MQTRRALRVGARRRPGFNWWRIGGGLLLLVLLAVVGVSVYVGWELSHAERRPLDTDPSAYGLEFVDVEFRSAEDNIPLRGWFLPASAEESAVQRSDGNTTIMMAHGFRGNRLQPSVPALELAASLVKSGFNVFMFDFRNSGISGGDVTTLGYHEVKDVLGAVAWLREHRPDEAQRMGIIGFSMGAVTAALAADREPAIGAVVLDSPFADLRPYLRENMPFWTGLPNVPFTWTIMAILPPLIDLNVAEVSPLAIMPGLSQPVLLIHTDGDEAIPLSNSEELAAAGHPDRTELWVVPGTVHVGARQVDAAAYDARVGDFFAEHLE